MDSINNDTERAGDDYSAMLDALEAEYASKVEAATVRAPA